MTAAQYQEFNEIAMTPVIESLMEACSNYLDEISCGEIHIAKAETALRLAMQVCEKYLNLKADLKENYLKDYD